LLNVLRLLLAVGANSNVSIIYVGSTYMFSCYANNSQNTIWAFEPLSLQDVWKKISVGNTVVAPRRYSVKYEHGNTYLKVTNIQHCDAGLFQCTLITDDGNQQRYEFLLLTVGKQVVVIVYCYCPFGKLADGAIQGKAKK